MLDLWLVCQFIRCGYKMDIRWCVWQRQVACFDQDPQRLQSSLGLYLNRKLAVLRSFSLWELLVYLFLSKTQLGDWELNLNVSYQTIFFQSCHFFWKLILSSREHVVFLRRAKLLAIIFCQEVFLLLLSCEISKGKNSPAPAAEQNTDPWRHFEYFCTLWNRYGFIVKC